MAVETTEDALLGGRVRLLQPRRGYRVAVDPVLLAAAVDARPGERVLDLGCGTGRLTAELADALGVGTIVALDISSAMLAEASRGDWRSRGARLHDASETPLRVHFVRADGAWLPFVDAFDAVFSAASFHWIPDHARLYASIYRALAPGGRLVAQAGGGPNLAVLLGRAHAMMESDPYREHFGRWSDPWVFADVPSTIVRLERAGFRNVHVSLEAAPTTLPDAEGYKDFLSCVCVRHHVARLPAALQARFLDALTAQAARDDPAFTLDYWRLNIAALKPAGAERAA